MKFKLKKELNAEANFSLVLPGPCNANCDFCFWKRSGVESPMYVQTLCWHLGVLGDKVTQISITGGEPTISPVFDSVMRALSEQPVYRKVVLTTNGHSLAEKLPLMEGVVDHINLSRHGVTDSANLALFGCSSVPSVMNTSLLCEQANRLGIDVTINRVVSAEYDDLPDFHAMVDLVKSVGASALTLRKDYSSNDLGKIPIEGSLGVAAASSSCPVCATNSYLFRGLPVHCKVSMEETDKEAHSIYELIFHPDGKLTEDWDGQKEVECVAEVETVAATPRPRVEHVPAPTPSASSCGSMQSGRC